MDFGESPLGKERTEEFANTGLDTEDRLRSWGLSKGQTGSVKRDEGILRANPVHGDLAVCALLREQTAHLPAKTRQRWSQLHGKVQVYRRRTLS